MTSIAVKVLSLTLAAYFIFIGVSKVTPKISRDFYISWRDAYKTFTIQSLRGPVKSATGVLVKSKYLRRGIGYAEIIAGILILPFFPGIISNLANVLLITVMALSIYMHFTLQRGFEFLAAPIVFTLLLIARLVMAQQGEKLPRAPVHPGTKYDKKEKLSDTESENTEQSELDDAAGDREKDE